MPTYAAVCDVPAERVAEAVRAGRIGGFVVGGEGGASVLFDPPPRAGGRISLRRLVAPARGLAARVDRPVWLLLADPDRATAVLCVPDGGWELLEWVDDWEPPTDPTAYLIERQEWDAHCQRLADAYGVPERGPALAAVRNDPVPGRSRPSVADLLRRVCAVFDLPDVAVGRSLLYHEEPGVHGAERVDTSQVGLLDRLVGRG